MTSNKVENLLHLVGWFSWKYCAVFGNFIRKKEEILTLLEMLGIMYKRRGCNIPQEFSLTATTLRECLTCDRARLQGRRHTQIFSIYHQLSLCSHSQRLESSFYFFSPSFPGSSSSSRPFQFLSEEFFGFPILLHSLQVTQPTHPLPFYPFYYIFSFTQFF